MKKNLLTGILLLWGTIVFSQSTPEAYLAKIPALSKDTCNVSKTSAQLFQDKVRELNGVVVNDLDARKEKRDATMENSEEAFREGATKHMAQQFGISQEDMEKMKNGKNLSEAEKQALANKMMMQQTNISMQEAKNLSKMSDAGKKAWAEAYSAEAMAAAQANPGKQPAGQNMAMNIASLVQSQNAIAQKLALAEQQITGKYQQLENDPQAKVMLEKISAWRTQWGALGGVDYGQGHKMDSLALLIKNEQIRYCRRFTPQLWKILNEHLAMVKASLPDYRKLADISGQILKAQTGVTSAVTDGDIECLRLVHEYLDRLEGAYSYFREPELPNSGL